jgi:transketolase N-terminal domain/subunit
MTGTEPEDEKDPKRACVVLSKGHEVVRLGYSRLKGAAAKVTNRGENSGNSSRVNQVGMMKQHYPSQVNQNSSTD